MNDNNSLLLRYTPWLALFAGGIVLWTTNVPLSSSRPTSNAESETTHSSDNSVFARLWQDPFSAVALEIREYDEEKKKGRAGSADSSNGSAINGPAEIDPLYSLDAVRDEFWRRCCGEQRSHGKILVLPVITPSGNLSSAVETRRRQRVATSLALLDSDFVPDDAVRLRFALQAIGSKGQLESEGSGTAARVTIPYEWWNNSVHVSDAGGSIKLDGASDSEAPHYEHVLVVWISEDARFNHIKFLDSVLHAIVGVSADQPPEYAIVGPTSSDGLNRWAGGLEALRENFAVAQSANSVQSQPSASPVDTPSEESQALSQALVDVFTAQLYSIFSGTGQENSCVSEALVKAFSDKGFIDRLVEDPASVQYAPALTTEMRAACGADGNEMLAADSQSPFEVYETLRNYVFPESDPAYIRQVNAVRISYLLSEIEKSSSLSPATAAIASQLFANANTYLDYTFYATREQIATTTECIAGVINTDKLKAWRRGDTRAGSKEFSDCLSKLGEMRDSVADWYNADDVKDYVVPREVMFESRFGKVQGSPVLDSNILSPRATGVESRLSFSSRLKQIRSSLGNDTADETFRSFVASDTKTLRALFYELAQRVDLCQEDSNRAIAIIYEAETNYGRQFRSLDAILKKQDGKATDEDRHICDNGRSPSFETIAISYLGGLDGERLQDGGVVRGSLPRSVANESGGDKVALAPNFPNGPANADSAIRIARYIAQLEPAREVVAVGVFGGDLWDKEVIFRAVRNELQSPILFTTDYDVYYNSAGARSWSQNLIVASPMAYTPWRRYGNDETGQLASSFRDTYQIATYEAVVTAVGHWTPKDPPEPNVLEVGRHSVYSFGLDDSKQGRARQAAFWTWLVCLTPIWLMLGYCAHRIATHSGKDSDRRWVTLSRSELAAYMISILFCLFVAIGFYWVLLLETSNPDGEPWMLTSGISLWPTQLLRGAATALCVSFVAIGFARMRISNARIETRFQLKNPFKLKFRLDSPVAPGAPVDDTNDKPAEEFNGWIGLVRELIRANRLDRHDALQSDKSHGSGDYLSRPFAKTGEWFYSLRQLERRPTAPTVDAERVWLQHQYLIDERPTVRHLVLWSTVVSAIVLLIFARYNTDGFVGRGATIHWVESFVRWVVVPATFALIFFVTRHTLHCEKLMKALRVIRFNWPAAAVKKVSERLDVDRETANRLLDLHFIGERTAFVSQLILMPFAVVFVLILSRNAWFDGLGWSPHMVLVFVGFSAFLVFRAVVLRRASEHARERIIRRLREQLVTTAREEGSTLATSEDRFETSKDQLKLLIDYCESYERGALAPWFRHPILQGLALPFAGVGAIILESLAY